MTKDRPPLSTDRPLAFTPNLAFGLLELRAADGAVELEIPARLLDMPEVIAALAAIADRGGQDFLKRVPDHHDCIVDPATSTLSFGEPVW